ncbi:MAG: radical SAM protein, partial [Nitrospiraceae bacterium]
RHGLPVLDRYARLELDRERRLVGYVEASRGCLHHCLHCPIVPVYDGRFFLIPEESVLEDIRLQAWAGATHITFGDPDFLNGPGHSLSIVRAMHKEYPSLTFDFTAKIEHLLKRRALLPELASLGGLFVVSAAESFSDAVLAHLEKGHTRAGILDAVTALRAAGITLRPSLVAFTPWTTLDDYLDMFDLVEAHDLIDAVDPVQYLVRLLIPPGSALLDHSDIRNFIVSLDQAEFQYRWAHPDERMDRLHGMVSAAVEEAAKSGEDPRETFQRVRALASGMAGRPAPAVRAVSHPHYRPPRLTEPWFCCAEPTAQQVRSLRPKGHAEV